MGILDEIEATTIVIDEGTILAIKATITFISINFDNVSRAMILATESAKIKSVLQVQSFCVLEDGLKSRDYKGDREGIPHIHPIP